MRHSVIAGVAGLMAASTLGLGSAWAEDFYAGKRITLYVAASPGGGYATYARAIARHWGRYLPGSPEFTVKHKQGAQGLVAASYLANKSKRDGTEILASYREAVTTTPLTITKGVHFDPVKLTYIGSATQSVGTCVAHKRTGIDSIDDVKQQSVKMGATHHRSLGYSAAYFMNNMFGTKFEVYHGYPAGSAIVLALQRGEVDARCGWSASSMKAMKPSWFEGEEVNILVQLSLKSHPELKGEVPLVMEYAQNEKQKQLLRLILTPQSVGRPYVAPPGLPADRVKLLRASFLETLNDDKFLQDAAKQRIDINPVTGEELETLVKELFETPKSLVSEMLDVTTKSDSVKLVKVEIPWQTDEVEVEGTKRKGRRVMFKADGEDVTVKVSKSRSEIMIDGKKAKRADVKAGMTCKITHKGDSSEAKSIECM